MDNQIMLAQYHLVLDSRNVLIEYCNTISSADLLFENHSFGRGGSIRNLFVHIANTYEFWIINKILNKNIAYTLYHSINTMEEIKLLFDRVNSYIFEFLEQYQESLFQKIAIEINGLEEPIEPFKLFTHVITHEFHHKGQILPMSRHLGYIPIDTDIIR
ncbi:DinB family protein [Pedobacter immunditicola]|uniref:DinB family protein n=1 Tax=Pedobacter immunditicola TaxID=3133440 RepID=UPI0030A956B7